MWVVGVVSCGVGRVNCSLVCSGRYRCDDEKGDEKAKCVVEEKRRSPRPRTKRRCVAGCDKSLPYNKKRDKR